jgi:hypothetical protein
MKAKNRTILIAASVVVAVVTALFVVYSPGGANKSTQPVDGGMGELRRFEFEQNQLDSNAPASEPVYTGMGGLHYYEHLQEASQDPEPLFADHPYLGMGDLRYYEHLQELQTNP